ncbi:MAG: trimethylamine methyltransferase family protein [Sulfitobacter litoralis]|jgi:trimethylamine--corrinoid protein Co-methyltransferase|uniref:Methyltransferase n=1 Tax=Sulfitobacter litoralis TaxID=335975 RepID=A0ABY0RZV8_9RHOB|nr:MULTISPECIES: trimethylamine methyltransferase family protein [Sulfitobacter]MBQ0716337.1 trimethylamine methyltransferase family protein [Sulfitobacter litoralis]MBQ0766642.1 trimethylamine methyltransferase family protein [Sulfitobacter litoralis]MBQ0802284.1 trimethylamine methyltransferase family protein [Sulfitobacter litoralis]MCF7725936.1 trimethylamine methyltransferase [Sulfitobacter sp. M22]SDO61251.1 trimethylamine---corrinoid protein Co-methyltransferase [Sulfitobacter litoralis|tara:strand:- start:1 stop:1539 length:1539 start_codon:yes stop_codon:yes gene_type:complete
MAESARRGRGGGGAARRAARSAVSFETAKYIERNIPNYEVLTEEALEVIEYNADTVLEEIGVNFPDNPEALALWRAAGAEVTGDRVRIPRGLARELCKTAPSQFTQHARNPARNVEIGGRNLVLAPVYGPPFVRDTAGGRRYATMDDFNKFVKLGYMSKWLHHSGGTVCEPTDVPVNKRHLDMLHAHMTLSDKPFMGSVTEPSRAQDSVDMCKILFGADFVDQNTVMTSLVNINSPLTFDDVMMGALKVFAENNQASIISPFIVGGAMAPVSVAGTLTQVLAEVMAGIAYSQLIRKGAPVIFGAFVTSIDMNSGAPTFGTPEAAHITYGAGQLARRMNLPFRSSGSFCGSKLPDAQAAYETANSLNMGLLSGVNFMLHACGWLEGGLVASFEKFVMDADQLGALHHLARGVQIDENAQAMDAIREVGPGGHYLGCAHTQANFKEAFWKSDLLDYKPFETWSDEGARDTQALAAARVEKLLGDYVQPEMDPDTRAALDAFVANRKAAEPDSFM